jgi:hypothetical protein
MSGPECVSRSSKQVGVVAVGSVDVRVERASVDDECDRWTSSARISSIRSGDVPATARSSARREKPSPITFDTEQVLNRLTREF